MNMVIFGAFLMVYFTLQLRFLHAKLDYNRYRRIKQLWSIGDIVQDQMNHAKIINK